MEFTWTPEQQDLRASTRRLLQQRAPVSRARELAEAGTRHDPQVWTALAQQIGLQGLAIPEEHGGSGASRVEQAVVLEEMGRVLLGGLPDAELDALLDKAQIRQVTPLTVSDKRKLREMIVQGRSDGYCTADGQLEVGIRSIAVPVRGRDGKIIAAINMGVPATRHTMESLVSQLLPILRNAASEIEFAIRSRP